MNIRYHWNWLRLRVLEAVGLYKPHHTDDLRKLLEQATNKAA